MIKLPIIPALPEHDELRAKLKGVGFHHLSPEDKMVKKSLSKIDDKHYQRVKYFLGEIIALYKTEQQKDTFYNRVLKEQNTTRVGIDDGVGGDSSHVAVLAHKLVAKLTAFVSSLLGAWI